jgi:hypothetical protein
MAAGNVDLLIAAAIVMAWRRRVRRWRSSRLAR